MPSGRVTRAVAIGVAAASLDAVHAEELLADPEPRIDTQAVLEHRMAGEEPSDGEPLEAASAVLVEHARHPSERFRQGQELLRVHLLAVDTLTLAGTSMSGDSVFVPAAEFWTP